VTTSTKKTLRREIEKSEKKMVAISGSGKTSSQGTIGPGKETTSYGAAGKNLGGGKREKRLEKTRRLDTQIKGQGGADVTGIARHPAWGSLQEVSWKKTGKKLTKIVALCKDGGGGEASRP